MGKPTHTSPHSRFGECPVERDYHPKFEVDHEGKDCILLRVRLQRATIESFAKWNAQEPMANHVVEIALSGADAELMAECLLEQARHAKG